MIRPPTTPLAAAALTMVLSGSALAAQQPDPLLLDMTSDVSPGRPMTTQPFFVQEDQERKNPAVAAGLEIVLPILGHAYAGNAKRGLLPTAVSVGGLVGLVARIDIDIFGDSEPETLDYMLLAAFLGGRVWGVVSAARTANDHNRSLSSGNANLSLFPTPDGRVGVGMNLRF